MKNVYDITVEFESRLAEYTGAPYVVTVDNQSNALFLALMYENVKDLEIPIPKELIHQFPVKLFMLVVKLILEKLKEKQLKEHIN